MEFITRTPYLVVRASQSVPFRTAFTTPEAGNYTLRFQLTKTDGAAPGTDAQGRFGEVATIPITVVTADGGNGDPQTPAPAPRLGFSCPVAEQIVEQGGSVSYSVNVSSRNAFEGAVAIAATQLPADATSPGASTSLTAGESKSLLVAVRTAATTPVGTHTVVFTASGEGVSDETCQSRLIVQAAADENANATLEIRPASAEVEVGQQVLFSAYYDPDGNGSEPEIAVTNVAAWSINDGAIAENGDDGRFTGRYPGAGIATAAYEGLTRSANLTVAAGVQAGIAVATDGTNWQSSLSGEESLTGVDLRGAIATPLTGPTRYTFYCNRPDAGLDVTSGFDLQTTTNQDQHTATNLCDYTQPGTYTAKVIVERAGFAAEARATIVVQARNDDPTDPNDPNDPTDPTDPNDPNNGRISCTFRANPKTLFIPPAKATTLSWTCDAPAACTVTNVTDSAQVGSGNENGSATDRPNSTKVYRLNCNGTNGGTFTEDLTLRVFDVTTRVEILPK